jgi:hypothetical protein
LETSSSFAD